MATIRDGTTWETTRPLRSVGGSGELDVNETENTGSFVARLELPEGDLTIGLERFHEFSPCQDGGIAAYLYEHGGLGLR